MSFVVSQKKKKKPQSKTKKQMYNTKEHYSKDRPICGQNHVEHVNKRPKIKHMF